MPGRAENIEQAIPEGGSVPESVPRQRPLITVVTPAYNEEKNLPELYRRLRRALDGIDADWEWVVLDDHSTDGTFEVLKQLAKQDGRIRGLRFSRNFGSHAALACGLNRARGDCAIVMASDLQDPPEEISQLLAEWRRGAHVVWAVRAKREGESAARLVFASLFYAILRRIKGLGSLPSTGADFFLIDRKVINALKRFQEGPLNIMALITWMGFRQASVKYVKHARVHGRSSWDLKRKLKLVIDSITLFSYFPLRLMSYMGVIVALLGFLYAGLIITNAILGNPVLGWSSLMVVLLVVSGLQMLMMGVLGEYLWRSLDESRRRPRFIIEEVITQREQRVKDGNDSLEDGCKDNHPAEL